MEIIKVSENSKLIRVKLGDIKPNRFRDLERWPVEREVIDGLKAAFEKEGFWSKSVQAIINDKNEVELRFGHHRVIAATEYFGADHEVEIDLVEYRGDNSMFQAMKLENSVNRNKVKVANELIDQSMHWFDDVVFDQYPTWEDVCNTKDNQAQIFLSRELEEYFGKFNENGPSNYIQCAEYGVGEGTLEKHTGCKLADIREYLKSNFTARRKRGMEIRVQRENEKAIAKRREEALLRSEGIELERIRREERAAEAAEKKRLKDEENRIAASIKKAKDEEERQRKEDEQAELKLRQQEAKQKSESAEAERVENERKQRDAAAKIEKERKQAEKNAKSVEIGEWYDSKASEVFDVPAHGKAFRESVSHDDVRPFITTEILVPFAKAVKERLENDTKSYGRQMLTDSNIRGIVNEFYREFKETMKIREREVYKNEAKENPALELIQAIKVCITDMNRCSASLFKVDEIMHKHGFTALDGPDVYNFMDGFRKVKLNMDKFNKLRGIE